MAKKSSKRSKQKKGIDNKKVYAPKNEFTKKDVIFDEKIEKESKNTRIIAAIPFIIAIVLYSCIWVFEPGPPVVDPWYAAVKLVDSSKTIGDPILKEKLLTEGGNKLIKLVKLHPYHARVHFFLGYYYFISQKWDSSLIELKEAAHLDTNSTINSIWPNAHDLIVKATINKSFQYINRKQNEKAKQLLLSALPYQANNPMLNKIIGSIHFDTGDYNTAMKYYMISLNGNPNDVDICYQMGIIYKNKNEINSAISYFKKALEINPNHKSSRINIINLYKLIGDNASASKYGG